MPTRTEHIQYNKVSSGELGGVEAATQMPDIPCRAVTFKACADNTGDVYIGAAGVTVADGTTDITTGVEMQPGDWLQFSPCSNLNIFYYICDSTADALTYLAML